MCCTRCDADTVTDSDLCEVHHAERELVAEHPTGCACWGCAKWFPRHTGLMARYRATAKAHPVTVALCHRLPRIALAIVTGAYLTAWDRAELGARADAAREAWIAAVEAEGDADVPEMSGSLSWDPRMSVLVPAVGL